MRLISLRSTARALALVVLGSAALPLGAQSAGNGYLFHAPEARITLRGGYALATANSDLFDFAIEELTLKRSDFSGLTLGAEIAIPVSMRWEISVDAGYSHARRASSFRHYVDNNDKEIEQATTFDRVPVTANLRYYLKDTGREIGKLAWIPTHVVPWVGAGAGYMYYRFQQKGDFVDFQTLNVFAGNFNSDNWTPMAQLLGGFDISLTPMLALTTEGRYLFAKGSVRGADFNGFNHVDLSGAQATVGLTVRM